MDNRSIHKGRCHCGSVQFDVKLIDEMNTAMRCTCSICTRRGAVVVRANSEDFVVTQGEEKISSYTFGTHIARHHFCSVCGIFTHNKSRSNPAQFGINLSCLDGQTPYLERVRVLDGKNHPLDQKHSAGSGSKPKAIEVGVLKFEGDRSRL